MDNPVNTASMHFKHEQTNTSFALSLECHMVFQVLKDLLWFMAQIFLTQFVV